ncbi:MAG: aconitate hydratase AcnA [Oligoflexales bacterium]|nr:aconitate hydratase AcnA [Oligoflexales bacterium]
MAKQNSFNTKTSMSVKGRTYFYHSLKTLDRALPGLGSKLPKSLKVILENLLRFEDGQTVKPDDIRAFSAWLKTKKSDHEIAFRPARVLMQDFTGVPAVVDLAAMRDAMAKLGGDPRKINPLSPVDLVIDHSVSVDSYAKSSSFDENVDIEFSRNQERYEFLRWAQTAFDNFRVVPPGTGICHQVNLEYLAQTVFVNKQDQEYWAYPDTLVGTDSHTTMVNGLSVLGWGVGGIEAEAAMLSQPVSMLIPEVVGVKLKGKLPEGTTATDLVLTITELLRKKGVVGKFVEFFGDGLKHLLLADRATIANMAPEYGATCGFFPIDVETINYLNFTGRDPDRVFLVEQYAKEQGLWWDENQADPEFTDIVEVDLTQIKASLAGPKRPQDRVLLGDAASAFAKALKDGFKVPEEKLQVKSPVSQSDYSIKHGDVAIAAITSCTNTSNPSVMLAAGLVAKKANALGLKVKPWVKTSLAPGSKVVSDYLEASGLQTQLDQLGFNLIGYGCTTCIGNSGPLKSEISQAIQKEDLVVCAVLSGNRNFEGRISPDIKANYLASPPLVVAYAIAGSIHINLEKDPIGHDKNGKAVFLRDVWPSNAEISETLKKSLTPEMFRSRYANVFTGPTQWQNIKTSTGFTYKWNSKSTYVQNPPYFTHMEKQTSTVKDIHQAQVLAIFGDSVTTDHISPAGSIKSESPAGKYLLEHGVTKTDFNSYGSRRGNHEVMMRGTFANIRIRNKMLQNIEGGYTRHIPSGEQTSIYDAAMRYQTSGKDLVIFAGKEYGTGSSRDWAAKGTQLLGVKAVIAESFERIHRSNLIGMGVLPFQFEGTNADELKLDGSEQISISGISSIRPRSKIECQITKKDGTQFTISLVSRIDTDDELTYLQNGGILHYVIRKLL